MTQVTLHGHLGQAIGKTWKIAISSVGEAMRAIDILSGRKLFKYLREKDLQGCKYRVLINKKPFTGAKNIDMNKIETVTNSDLCLKIKELTSIDIVPVLEGDEGDAAQIIIGVLLIVVGVVLNIYAGGAGGLGNAMVLAGIGLIVNGIINLLSTPPNPDDYDEKKDDYGTSYLFSGPQNTIREGGPVPVGYGRLLIGSQVIAASYNISHKAAGADLTV